MSGIKTVWNLKNNYKYQFYNELNENIIFLSLKDRGGEKLKIDPFNNRCGFVPCPISHRGF